MPSPCKQRLKQLTRIDWLHCQTVSHLMETQCKLLVPGMASSLTIAECCVSFAVRRAAEKHGVIRLTGVRRKLGICMCTCLRVLGRLFVRGKGHHIMRGEGLQRFFEVEGQRHGQECCITAPRSSSTWTITSEVTLTK